jgi:hypothetical protein
VLSIVAIVIALASAVAAFGLWRSARRANEIAAKAVAIDASRRHEERTPEFDVNITERSATPDHALMTVKLVQPAHVDEVVIKILDEAAVDHWGHGRPDGVTEQQAKSFVWGRWEFNTGASEQIVDNRTTRPRRYSRGNGKDSDILDLVKTRPGHWMNDMAQKTWERERSGPVRLSFECVIDGGESWQVSYDVQVKLRPGDL